MRVHPSQICLAVAGGIGMYVTMCAPRNASTQEESQVIPMDDHNFWNPSLEKPVRDHTSEGLTSICCRM